MFKMIRVQLWDNPGAWSAMENDAAEIAWLLLHALVFFLLARHRWEMGWRVCGEDSCPAKTILN